MNTRSKYTLAFGLLGAIFYIPFLGGVHLFDWDEINFAEISREMLITRDYLRVYVDFEPFWEKPPFFFWLQAGAMAIFGVGEFAARFPNALCGILTLMVLYNIGKTLYNHRFGIIWAGVYFGSILPFLYFKSGIIDPWFNLFIFLGIYYFIKYYWSYGEFSNLPFKNKKWIYLIAGGLFIGMGILTKGPVAYLIAVLTMGVYWIFKRFKLYVNPLHFIVFTLAAALATLTWYGLETLRNGAWFITEFNRYQYRLFSTPDAGHRGFPGYHFVVLLIGVFPASIFTIRSFMKMPKPVHDWQKDFKLWMSILFWVVLILFTIVKSKIVHYSSMCYFPMTYLAATVIFYISINKMRFRKWMKGGVALIGSIFALATIALPFFGQNIEILVPLFEKDPFAVANLIAEVNWSVLNIIPGVFLLVVLIFSFYKFSKKHYTVAFTSLFGGTALFVMLTLIFDINNIEAYSQQAAIEFFKEKGKEDAYIITSGYKSYAHLFYTGKQGVENPNYYDKEWLLTGDIDKDVYVVTKINKTKSLENYPELKRIGEKNGFVFYKRNK